jgi:hypothetical protein
VRKFALCKAGCSQPGLKKTRYVWLKRPSKLTARQKEDLGYLRRRHRRTARAYELKLEFDDLWELTAAAASGYLNDWCDRVYRSRFEPLKDFVDTIDAHWDDVLRWFRHGSPTASWMWRLRRLVDQDVGPRLSLSASRSSTSVPSGEAAGYYDDVEFRAADCPVYFIVVPSNAVARGLASSKSRNSGYSCAGGCDRTISTYSSTIVPQMPARSRSSTHRFVPGARAHVQ